MRNDSTSDQIGLILSRVYSLILSWSDPGENEPIDQKKITEEKTRPNQSGSEKYSLEEEFEKDESGEREL